MNKIGFGLVGFAVWVRIGLPVPLGGGSMVGDVERGQCVVGPLVDLSLPFIPSVPEIEGFRKSLGMSE